MDDFKVLSMDASLNRSSSALLNKVSAQFCHHRLGQLSSIIFDLLKYQLGCDFPIQNYNLLVTYVLWLNRKNYHLSLNHLSQIPYNLLHCDIWTPYYINAHFGHRIFLTIVDDCTRFT